MSNKKRVTAARSKPTVKAATREQAIALSTLTVDQFVKALADTMVSANAAQSNQISSQLAQQVANQVSETIGKLQSDMATRTISSTTTERHEDVDSTERMKANAGREDGLLGYKSNVTDFIIGTNAVANQQAVQSAVVRMIEGSLNHYNTMLSDERIQKAGILGAQNRHTDIAVEKQWATSQKNLSDAIVADVVKGLNDDVKKK